MPAWRSLPTTGRSRASCAATIRPSYASVRLLAPPTKGFGRGLVKAMPILLKLLAIVGNGMSDPRGGQRPRPRRLRLRRPRTRHPRYRRRGGPCGPVPAVRWNGWFGGSRRSLRADPRRHPDSPPLPWPCRSRRPCAAGAARPRSIRYNSLHLFQSPAVRTIFVLWPNHPRRAQALHRKASKPELKPLDTYLADLLNPAVNRERGGGGLCGARAGGFIAMAGSRMSTRRWPRSSGCGPDDGPDVAEEVPPLPPTRFPPPPQTLPKVPPARPPRGRARRSRKAASASGSSPTSNPRATSRRRSRELVDGVRRAGARPGAARRHRLGQDLHDGQGDRGDAAPGADPRAEQDARGAALRRVQVVLPRTTRSSTSSPTTTTTSPRPTSRARTPTSRRNPRSTSRSTACATRRRARCSSATTSSSSPPCRASTASARSRPTRR